MPDDNNTANSSNNVQNNNNEPVKNSPFSIIEDQTGGISSIRVLMLAWGLGVLIVWGSACIMQIMHGVYVFPQIPETVLTVLLGVTGIKTVQRPFEK